MGGGQFSPGHGELTPQQHSRLQAARGCGRAIPPTCPRGSALPLASVRAHPQMQRCLSPPRVDVPCPTLAAELGLSWGLDWQVLL